MWRVAANILNKHRGQPTRGGPPAWGVGRGANTSPSRPSAINRLFSKGKRLLKTSLLCKDLTRKPNTVVTGNIILNSIYCPGLLSCILT
jgi:hypothetical protein